MTCALGLFLYDIYFQNPHWFILPHKISMIGLWFCKCVGISCGWFLRYIYFWILIGFIKTLKNQHLFRVGNELRRYVNGLLSNWMIVERLFVELGGRLMLKLAKLWGKNKVLDIILWFMYVYIYIYIYIYILAWRQ